MARSRKCDRCGSFYEKNILYKTRNRICGGVISGVIVNDASGRPDKFYDLCDKCIGELFDFLRNGR